MLSVPSKSRHELEGLGKIRFSFPVPGASRRRGDLRRASPSPTQGRPAIDTDARSPGFGFAGHPPAVTQLA